MNKLEATTTPKVKYTGGICIRLNFTPKKREKITVVLPENVMVMIYKCLNWEEQASFNLVNKKWNEIGYTTPLRSIIRALIPLPFGAENMIKFSKYWDRPFTIKNMINLIKFQKEKSVNMDSFFKISEEVNLKWFQLHNNFRDFVFRSLAYQGLLLKEAHEDLKNDREIVKCAVKQHGDALQYAHPDLQKDLEIVQLAFEQRISSIQYADPKLSKDFILKNVHQYSCLLQYAHPSYSSELAFAYEVISKNPFAYKHATKEIRKTPEIALMAIKKNNYILNYLHDDLRKDDSFINELIKINPQARYFKKELK